MPHKNKSQLSQACPDILLLRVRLQTEGRHSWKRQDIDEFSFTAARKPIGSNRGGGGGSVSQLTKEHDNVEVTSRCRLLIPGSASSVSLGTTEHKLETAVSTDSNLKECRTDPWEDFQG